MEWISCKTDHIGQNAGPYPTEPGHYRVMISGDSESDDMGGVIYEYGDYETWAWFDAPDADGDPVVRFEHGEEIEWVVAWCGPLRFPEYKRGM